MTEHTTEANQASRPGATDSEPHDDHLDTPAIAAEVRPTPDEVAVDVDRFTADLAQLKIHGDPIVAQVFLDREDLGRLVDDLEAVLDDLDADTDRGV